MLCQHTSSSSLRPRPYPNYPNAPFVVCPLFVCLSLTSLLHVNLREFTRGVRSLGSPSEVPRWCRGLAVKYFVRERKLTIVLDSNLALTPSLYSILDGYLGLQYWTRCVFSWSPSYAHGLYAHTYAHTTTHTTIHTMVYFPILLLPIIDSTTIPSTFSLQLYYIK